MSEWEITNRLYFGRLRQPIFKEEKFSENLNRIIADKAGICSGDSILDVSCNEGENAIWLGTAFPDAQVYGVSLLVHHIRLAGKIARKKGLKHVYFSVKDQCKTDFPDAHFTVVWARESLCHPALKIDFYKEAYRILKPGGRLVIADGIRKSRMFPLHDELLFRELLASWLCPDLDTWEEHYKHIVQAGFSRFQMQDISPLLESVLSKRTEAAGGVLPLRKLLGQVIPKGKSGYPNVPAVMQQYEAFQKGLWTYGLVLAVKP